LQRSARCEWLLPCGRAAPSLRGIRSFAGLAICQSRLTATTLLNAVLVSIESIVGWLLSSIAIVVEYFECIPVLGALVRWLVNLVTALVWIIVSFWDIVAGLVGIRPEKILRVCPVILSDEKGEPVASVETWSPSCSSPATSTSAMRIVPLRPFHYASGWRSAAPRTLRLHLRRSRARRKRSMYAETR
jgi:hypothetical protein